jgi:spore coat protein CotH
MRATSIYLRFFLTFFVSIPLFSQKDMVIDLYDPTRIQDIRITVAGSDWQNQLDQIVGFPEKFYPASITLNGETFPNAGIRFRPGSGYQTASKKNCILVNLDLSGEKKYQGIYQNLHLSNALRDPSLIREILGYEIARKYTIAPGCNFSIVHVNGEFLGVFPNVQPVDSVFLKSRFSNGTGPLFVPKTENGENPPKGCNKGVYGSLEFERTENCLDHNFEKFNSADFKPLMNLTRTLAADVKNLEKVLDIDQTLWMLALNNVLVNLSSYSGFNSQNYYLYQKPNGQFVPIPWDYNLAFGSFKNADGKSDLDLKGSQKLDPMLHSMNTLKPLIFKLLSNPTYKKMYLSHVKSILDDYITNGLYEKRAKELQAIIKTHGEADPNAYYSKEDFSNSLTKTIGKLTKIPGIIELMSARGKFLKNTPLLSVIPPSAESHEVKKRKPSEGPLTDFKVVIRTKDFPKTVRLMYRFDQNSAWKSVLMRDDGRSHDIRPADNIFGISVKSEGDGFFEYYFILENQATIGFDPPNYMWTKYQTTLNTINTF